MSVKWLETGKATSSCMNHMACIRSNGVVKKSGIERILRNVALLNYNIFSWES